MQQNTLAKSSITIRETTEEAGSKTSSTRRSPHRREDIAQARKSYPCVVRHGDGRTCRSKFRTAVNNDRIPANAITPTTQGTKETEVNSGIFTASAKIPTACQNYRDPYMFEFHNVGLLPSFYLLAY